MAVSHTLDKKPQARGDKDGWLVLEVVTTDLDGGGFPREDTNIPKREQEEEGDAEEQAYSI